jgi:hypothetical protein
MPLPKALQGDRWSEKTARKIFPVLIWYAKNERTITYSEIDQLIVSKKWDHHVMYVQYGRPAGAIGNALLETEHKWNQPLPPLNALIVSKKTGIPGKGCDYYLKHFLGDKKKNLSEADRKSLTEATHEKIFNFTKWDTILREYGLPQISFEIQPIKKRPIIKPVHNGWSNEGESPEHEKLKLYVANNPVVLGMDIRLPKGNCECVLASSDRPDILFTKKDFILSIEVKSRLSNDADLQRGIFQCIKYRAVIRAEQKARQKVPNAMAILVTERSLPEPLKELADLLDISFIVINN